MAHAFFFPPCVESTRIVVLRLGFFMLRAFVILFKIIVLFVCIFSLVKKSIICKSTVVSVFNQL